MRLFVYGTLKRGFASEDRMRGATFEGSVRTRPGYALHDLGEFPALVADSDGVVEGEVYLITAEHLMRLDEYEGCPALYRREPVVLSDGSVADAYLMTHEGVSGWRRIAEGVWRRGAVGTADF